MTSQDKDTNENFDNWVRGYVFVTSDDPETSASIILNLNNNYNKGDGFIIRADTMHGPPPNNVMVTINTKTDARFTQIAADIRGVPGVKDAIPSTVAIHKTYHPDPPHSARGYVSADEYLRDPSGPNPGPQDHNVWG